MEVFTFRATRKRVFLSTADYGTGEVVDEAYAGDIIGVFGFFQSAIQSLQITRCSSRYSYLRSSISSCVRKAQWKRKRLSREQARFRRCNSDFQELDAGMEEVIGGVVGVLQFDVLKYRLETSTT